MDVLVVISAIHHTNYENWPGSTFSRHPVELVHALLSVLSYTLPHSSIDSYLTCTTLASHAGHALPLHMCVG